MGEHERRDHLKRLPREFYRGQVCVHWSMAMRGRKTGWLMPTFYYKFREILTHTMFRYGLCCPIYCCMPDHIHMLWNGILDGSDQLTAARFLRTQLQPLLERLDAKLQHQAYDHVLRDEEHAAVEDVAEYIARNPERAGLVESDGYAMYKYTGCLLPGYPDLKPFQHDYWDLVWRICSRLREDGFARLVP